MRGAFKPLGVLLFLSVLLAWVQAAPVYSEEGGDTRTIEVIGTSKIYKGGIAAARAAAISTGLVAAVDQIVVETLPSGVRVERFFDLGRLLHDLTGNFVQGYRVLTETRIEKTYRVMIEATVLENQLRSALKDAGLLTEGRTLPVVLVLLSQQGLDDLEPQYWWREDFAFQGYDAENVLNEVLTASNLRVMGHRGLLASEAVRPINNNPLPGDDPLLEIGRQMEAELIIIGAARASRAPNTMGGDLRSFQGTLSARVLRVNTGAEIAAVSHSTVTVHRQDEAGSRAALAAVGRMAAEELAAKIVQSWQQAARSGEAIELQVQGSGVLAHFVAFRQGIEALAGVQSVLIREMTPDSAQLTVAFRGDARALADALVLTTFESFGIHIYDVEASRLQIELIQE